MERKRKYNDSDSMSELVEDNYRVLLIMSRFGIGLGFGERNIGEVCRTNGVDTGTFLAIVNLMLDTGHADECDTSKVSPESLLDYLTKSHEYYIGFRLPSIRKALVEILDNPDDNLSGAVIRYFDEYMAEMRRHTAREDKTLFPYVHSLIQGKRNGRSRVGDLHKKHDQIQTRLAEFKRILVKYYPAQSTNRLNNVLFDVYNYEHDLTAHNRVEDKLLIPIVEDLERKIETKS